MRKVQEIVLNDRRVNIQEIAEARRISLGTVHHILHEEMGMKKISARWLPRLLTSDQKLERIRTSEAGLELIQRNGEDFWRRFITVDETWIHHYTPESKQDSMQWMGPGERPPIKARTVPSAAKVMATVFWDCKGVILINYLEAGSAITGLYYTALLDRLDEAIRARRPGLQRKKVLFHQDNAPAHRAAVTMAKLNELGYQIVQHPPYSPDLAPSDFFLFQQLKKMLSGQRYSTNGEVISAVESFLSVQDVEFFSNGMKALQHRWNKCVEVRGDYVEK